MARKTLDELRPLLKPDKAQEAGKVLTGFMMRVVSKTHSGPIPSAEELEHLDRVQPGFANRCVEMAEREQCHRHGLETSVVSYEGSLRQRGQIFALLALIVLVLAVAWLAYLGFGQSAAALGTATIVGVVGVFAAGRYFDVAATSSSETTSEQPKSGRPPARRKK